VDECWNQGSLNKVSELPENDHYPGVSLI
jgi:hypothetical protein